jgi:hypothetical protein
MALHGERPLISLEHPLPGGAVLDQPAQVFENLPFNVNGRQLVVIELKKPATPSRGRLRR